MPIHDWTRVDAGIFHSFHLRWIELDLRRLERGLLPRDHYAMGERRAIGDEPDVLTLHAAPSGDAGEDDAGRDSGMPAEVCLAPPGRIIDEATRISTGASRIAWSSGT